MRERAVPSTNYRREFLATGVRVEVRSSFEGSWCRGFEVAWVVVGDRRGTGYRLRRQSDGAVLDAIFPAEDVIPMR